MSRRIYTLLALTLSGAGCDAILGSSPKELRKASILDLNDEPVAITVPDSVNVGESFQVRVRSYGTGCRTLGQTPVVVQGAVAQVAPYEMERLDSSCPAILQTFDHTAQVAFASAGIAHVVVLGVREPEHEEITVSRQVVVR